MKKTIFSLAIALASCQIMADANNQQPEDSALMFKITESSSPNNPNNCVIIDQRKTGEVFVYNSCSKPITVGACTIRSLKKPNDPSIEGYQNFCTTDIPNYNWGRLSAENVTTPRVEGQRANVIYPKGWGKFTGFKFEDYFLLNGATSPVIRAVACFDTGPDSETRYSRATRPRMWQGFYNRTSDEWTRLDQFYRCQTDKEFILWNNGFDPYAPDAADERLRMHYTQRPDYRSEKYGSKHTAPIDGEQIVLIQSGELKVSKEKFLDYMDGK